MKFIRNCWTFLVLNVKKTTRNLLLIRKTFNSSQTSLTMTQIISIENCLLCDILGRKSPKNSQLTQDLKWGGSLEESRALNAVEVKCKRENSGNLVLVFAEILRRQVKIVIVRSRTVLRTAERLIWLIKSYRFSEISLENKGGAVDTRQEKQWTARITVVRRKFIGITAENPMNGKPRNL